MILHKLQMVLQAHEPLGVVAGITPLVYGDGAFMDDPLAITSGGVYLKTFRATPLSF